MVETYKLWYIYAMENYLVMKRNKLLKHAVMYKPKKHYAK